METKAQIQALVEDNHALRREVEDLGLKLGELAVVLGKSDARLFRILDLLGHGVALLDGDGRVIFLNLAWSAQLDGLGGDMAGLRFSDLVLEKDAPRLRAAFEQLRSGRPSVGLDKLAFSHMDSVAYFDLRIDSLDSLAGPQGHFMVCLLGHEGSPIVEPIAATAN